MVSYCTVEMKKMMVKILVTSISYGLKCISINNMYLSCMNSMLCSMHVMYSVPSRGCTVDVYVFRVPGDASRLTNSSTWPKSQTNHQREPTNRNYMGRSPTNRNYYWESGLFLPNLIRRTRGGGERGE